MYKECMSVILVLLAQNILISEAIKCYKCLFEAYVYATDGVFRCKDFDYSEKFIVDCAYSTFCMTKNSYTKINGVQINGTERDCALQKLDTQKLSNGKWHPETQILEPYTEGCITNKDKGVRTAKVEHCYCKGDLCNSGNSLFSANDVFYYRTLAISVTSLFVIPKAVKLAFL